MKKILTIPYLGIFVFVAMLFAGTDTYASCTITGTDSTGTLQTIEIDCNFPVFVDTGVPEVDGPAYDAAKQDWMIYHTQDYLAITSLNGVYYTILQADFDLMPPLKQQKLLTDPDMYRIIP